MTPAQTARVTWTIVSIFIVESLIFGLAVLPAFLFWTWTLDLGVPDRPLVRPVTVAPHSCRPTWYLRWPWWRSRLVHTALRLAHAARRRVEAARPGVAAAQLVALHDLHPHRPRAGGHALPRLADLDLVPAVERRNDWPRGLHQQPVDLRSQHARVRRRRRHWRKRAPVGPHGRGWHGQDGPRAAGAIRDRRARQYGRHWRRSGREVSDRRAQRGAQIHQAGRRQRLRRRAREEDREARARRRAAGRGG